MRRLAVRCLPAVRARERDCNLVLALEIELRECRDVPLLADAQSGVRVALGLEQCRLACGGVYREDDVPHLGRRASTFHMLKYLEMPNVHLVRAARI